MCEACFSSLCNNNKCLTLIIYIQKRKKNALKWQKRSFKMSFLSEIRKKTNKPCLHIASSVLQVSHFLHFLPLLFHFNPASERSFQSFSVNMPSHPPFGVSFFTACIGRTLSTRWSHLPAGSVWLLCFSFPVISPSLARLIAPRWHLKPTRLVFAVWRGGQLVEEDVGIAAANLAGGHRAHPAQREHTGNTEARAA